MAHDEVPGWQDEMLAEYRRVAAALDPPPPDLAAAAKAAFAARDLDAEIALLIADSRTEAGAALYEPVRAEPDLVSGRWLLSFDGGGIQAEIEVEAVDGHLRLLGLLSGASAEDCYLETAGAHHRVDVDDLGRFIVEHIAPGPIRLRCRSTEGIRVTTAWVTV
ncbi:hypothetical protein [Dactylosporangium matsuzakiense]|uniref:Uncharacterized protein n=1 Tax=Dactylosporangium matsuzakiense TaxID=53360 RepID=A0A9W6KQS7_9ACTN|nr:hypothetical protein [Dactylosporangium matsuzakiense]UWZ42850.1 hypothetical protein Dmats_35795 [Dactylosporangium matsuzakiense]GLL04715.1 hypothetical protein GCM10017581_064620 [Dactylosporangium matsuzakiense]